MSFPTQNQRESEYAPAEAFNICKLSPELKAIVDDDVKRLEDKFAYTFEQIKKAKTDTKGDMGNYLRLVASQFEAEALKGHHKLSWIKVQAYQKTDAEFNAANPGWETAVKSFDDALDFTLATLDMAMKGIRQ